MGSFDICQYGRRGEKQKRKKGMENIFKEKEREKRGSFVEQEHMELICLFKPDEILVQHGIVIFSNLKRLLMVFMATNLKLRQVFKKKSSFIFSFLLLYKGFQYGNQKGISTRARCNQLTNSSEYPFSSSEKYKCCSAVASANRSFSY